MKTTAVLLALLIAGIIVVNAQPVSYSGKKNSWGADFYSMNHQLTKFEPTLTTSINPGYYGLHTNASVDYSLWYKREFAKDSSSSIYLKAHIMMSDKFGEVWIDSTTDARVSEQFIQFPILIGYTMSAGKSVALNMGFGLNYSVLLNQKYSSIPGIILPSAYQKEYGFNSYSKLGFAVEISPTFYISKRAFVNIGIWSDFDIGSPLAKSKDIPQTTMYRSFGTFIGYGLSF